MILLQDDSVFRWFWGGRHPYLKVKFGSYASYPQTHPFSVYNPGLSMRKINFCADWFCKFTVLGSQYLYVTVKMKSLGKIPPSCPTKCINHCISYDFNISVKIAFDRNRSWFLPGIFNILPSTWLWRGICMLHVIAQTLPGNRRFSVHGSTNVRTTKQFSFHVNLEPRSSQLVASFDSSRARLVPASWLVWREAA